MVTGYSGTPLIDKLGVRDGFTVAVLDPPPDHQEILGLPPSVRVVHRLGGHRDLVLHFVTRSARLRARVPALMEAIAPDGAVWVIWPKKSSRVPTDVTEDVIRSVVLPSGLVDVKVCAVDLRWSGLKLVIRRELRTPRSADPE